MINKFFLFVGIICFNITVAQNIDRNLLYVDGQGVDVDDFLSIYNKNRDVGEAIDPQTLDEYLELFINFKLKVREAEYLGMDTVSSFIKELEGYRRQLAIPYLVDNQTGDSLVVEAYERMKYEIRASHILISVPIDASPSDTLKAFNKINEIRNDLLNGSDFSLLAKTKSEDPSAKNNFGDLGYFSALFMVYPFENAAFNTQVGNISEIIRTRFGYHILKVTDKRNSRGEIKTAHIMVKFPKAVGQNSSKEISNARIKANEIYEKITIEGANFSEMAKQYSDDKNNSSKGGELPWFGSNRMVESFENAAFAINNKGEMTPPVQTPFGWHIIKLLDKKGLGSFEEEKEAIKSKVEKDSRSRMKRTSLINKLKSEYNFTTNISELEYFKSFPISDFISGSWKINDYMNDLNSKILTFADQNYSKKDFAEYLLKSAKKEKNTIEMSFLVDKIFNAWSEAIIIEYENSCLESKYNDFRLLMQEYRDGILLYELTDEKIWSKAMTDTSGLNQYYESNKTDYMWDTRVEAKIINCANNIIATKIQSKLLKGQDIDKIQAKINQSSSLNMTIEEGVFLKGENIFVDQVEWQKGYSDFILDNNNIKIVYIDSVLSPTVKLLSEAKGLITSNYQDFLEKKWISELRKKYEVSLNQEIWRLLKSNRLDELNQELHSIDNLDFQDAFRQSKISLGISKDTTFKWRGNYYTTEQK